MFDKSVLLALTIAVASSSTLAESLTATGYSYVVSPDGSYPDSGNELLDGFVMSNGWGNSTMTYQTASPYSGWYIGNAVVTFTFDGPVNVDTVTVYADNADGAAGVWFPSLASIVMGGTTLSGLTINDPPGSSPASISFTNLGLSGDSLMLTIGNPSGWIMLSEVQFTSATAVPVPTAVWLFGSALASLGWFGRRRTA